MAIKKIYGTYRYKWTNTWVRYTPSYFLDKQYEDYLKAWLTKLLDTEIPENRYTAEIVAGIKKMTRFAIGEYEDTVVDPVAFADNISKVWAEFCIQMFNTPAEAVAWLEANTDLTVINKNKDADWVVISAEFEINPERTDEKTGETIPAKTLLID